MKDFRQVYKEIRVLEKYIDTGVLDDHFCGSPRLLSCTNCPLNELSGDEHGCSIFKTTPEENLMDRYFIVIEHEGGR